MKLLLISTVAAMAVFAANADEEVYVSPITGQPFKEGGEYTLEQIKARDERVLQKTGGFVEVKATGLSVLLLDTRVRPGGAAVQFQDVFSSLSKTNVKVEKQPLDTGEKLIEKLASLLKANNAAYGIAIVEDAAMSGLSVFPEERIAIVNAVRYKGGDDPLRPEVRVHKEIWRALGFVAGIGYAPFENDVMQPVFSVKELDSQVYQVMQPMNFQKMYVTLKNLGVTRARRVPYRVAINEGWAHSPTNEYEKAVWEEVKAEKNKKPSNPLKVNFDPKTAPKVEK